MQLPETDWRELQQMLDLWRQQKLDFSIKAQESKWRSCKPRTNIFFLKTHKTASSTIVNILFRYGEFHNLKFAFPVIKYHFDYPSYFSTRSVFGFSAKNKPKYNIMCHHMRFYLAEVENVMPSDTFYFTILRNPVTLMESSFAYYRDSSSFIRAKNIETFLNNTNSYYQNMNYDGGYARNLMTFDLGFNHNGPESEKQFKLLWRAVDTMFNLVLIAEYFDESLVLLKDALCWTLDDVLSIPLNTRSDRSRRVLSVETEEKIKSWNQLDWQLYMYFNNSFWNRVERFGKERMEKEVEELRRRRAQVSEKCLDDHVEPYQLRDKSMVPYQPFSARILGYNLKSGLKREDQQLCHRLVLPELQYSELLWTKHFKK
ncbi:galactose-3-O-sulfotransferase 2-like [Leptodactylus fuscus]|uniref:galactose-3-O-sulfotransferase 2-like n=1 Tax=Leptodactylus fuscus TaxID=238119 RepID=UPI003F4E4C16